MQRYQQYMTVYFFIRTVSINSAVSWPARRRVGCSLIISACSVVTYANIQIKSIQRSCGHNIAQYQAVHCFSYHGIGTSQLITATLVSLHLFQCDLHISSQWQSFHPKWRIQPLQKLHLTLPSKHWSVKIDELKVRCRRGVIVSVTTELSDKTRNSLT